MATKIEGMRVDLCHDAATTGADVCEYALCFGVFAQRFEVEVIDWRALGFVQRWTGTSDVLNVGRGGFGVPWQRHEHLLNKLEVNICKVS